MKHLLNRFNNVKYGETIASMQDVTKRFDGAPIISDINLEVKKGDFLLITGPSGSGKSTILRTFEGLERPDEGTVTIMGKSLYEMSAARAAKLKSRHLGIGFQAHNLDTGMTLSDNIESLAEARGDVDYERMGKLIVSLGLQDKAMRRESVANLSGGEKQRVALARLLLTKPDIVLLDEPTAAIDPVGKSRIYETLRQMNEEEQTTFIVVSHDTIAHDFATREVVVDSGIIRDDRPTAPRPFTPAA